MCGTRCSHQLRDALRGRISLTLIKPGQQARSQCRPSTQQSAGQSVLGLRGLCRPRSTERADHRCIKFTLSKLQGEPDCGGQLQHNGAICTTGPQSGMHSLPDLIVRWSAGIRHQYAYFLCHCLDKHSPGRGLHQPVMKRSLQLSPGHVCEVHEEWKLASGLMLTKSAVISSYWAPRGARQASLMPIAYHESKDSMQRRSRHTG